MSETGEQDCGHGLDRRRHAVRDDLADERLRDRVAASAYRHGAPRLVVTDVLAVHRAPDAASMRESEAIWGERFDVFDVADGWAWGQCGRDGYVGYVPVTGLSQSGSGAHATPATHRVTAMSTFRFAAPDIKSRVLGTLVLNAPLRVTDGAGPLLELADGAGFVASQHVAPLGVAAADHAAVAERFVGTPYLWGGISRHGIDCSGLVQMCLMAAGHACPRDSDMQRDEVGALAMEGEALMSSRGDEAAGLRRGDLVFWPGHVAMMVSATHMVHANAHHMSCEIEPFWPAVDRIAAAGSSVTCVKRMVPPAA